MSNTIPANNYASAISLKKVYGADAAPPSEKRAPVEKPAMVEPLNVIDANVQDISRDASRVRRSGAELNERMLEQLKEATSRLQQAVESTPTRLKLLAGEVASRFMITVTGEVIRQVPSEAVLRIAHSIERMKGLLFDKRL